MPRLVLLRRPLLVGLVICFNAVLLLRLTQDRLQELGGELSSSSTIPHRASTNKLLYANAFVNSTQSLLTIDRYRCLKRKLPSNVPTGRPYLNTNLNILIAGDSIGMQLAYLLQGAASVSSLSSQQNNHTVLQRCHPVTRFECLHYNQAHDHNYVAGWRLLNMWRSSGPTKNVSDGGYWSLEHMKQLQRTTTNHYDVLLFRIPVPWVSLFDVTETALDETIDLARQVMGITTVIFTTLTWNNNYRSVDEFDHLQEVNSMLRHFVDDYRGDSNVLLLQLDTLVHGAVRESASIQGSDVSNHHAFLLERVQDGSQRRFPRSKALVCNNSGHKNTTAGCVPNAITVDGMHLCMETFGPSIVLGFACLLQCAYHHPKNSTGKSMQECDHECNAQYMQWRSNTLAMSP